MIDNHVTSLEISKRLKELGVKQESEYWWVDYTDGYSQPAWNLNSNHIGYKAHISAFLTSELADLLPDFYRVGKHIYSDNGFVCSHYDQEMQQVQTGNTMPDAMGKMLIYLLEQGIIRV